MNEQHLTEYELEELLISEGVESPGDPSEGRAAALSATAAAHFRECLECRSAYGHLKNDVTLLRAGIVAWGEQAILPERFIHINSVKPRPAIWRSPRWGLIAASIAAMLVVVTMFGIHHHYQQQVVERQQGVAQPAAITVAASVDDAELMRQIDAQLHQSEPTAMEPLTALIQNTSSSGTPQSKGHIKQ